MASQNLIDNIEDVEGQPDALFHTFFTSNQQAALLACDRLGVTPNHMMYRSKEAFVTAVANAPKKSMKKNELDLETQAQIRYNMQERHRQLLFNDLFAVRQAIIASGKVDDLWRQREELIAEEDEDLIPDPPLSPDMMMGSTTSRPLPPPQLSSESVSKPKDSNTTTEGGQTPPAPTLRAKGKKTGSRHHSPEDQTLYPAPPQQAPVSKHRTLKDLDKEETSLYDSLMNLTSYAAKHAETEKRTTAHQQPQRHQGGTTGVGGATPRQASASSTRALNLYAPIKRMDVTPATTTQKRLQERLGSARFPATARSTPGQIAPLNRLWSLGESFNSLSVKSTRTQREAEQKVRDKEEQDRILSHRKNTASPRRNQTGGSSSQHSDIKKGLGNGSSSLVTSTPENQLINLDAPTSEFHLQQIQRTNIAQRQTAALLRVKMNTITAKALDEQRYRLSLQEEEEMDADERFRQQTLQRRRAASPSTYTNSVAGPRPPSTRRSSVLRESRKQIEQERDDDRQERLEVRLQNYEERIERIEKKKKSKNALDSEMHKAKQELIAQNKARAKRAEELRVLALHHERENKRKRAEDTGLSKKEQAAKSRIMHEKESMMRKELNEQIYDMEVRQRYYVPELLANTRPSQSGSQLPSQQQTSNLPPIDTQ